MQFDIIIGGKHDMFKNITQLCSLEGSKSCCSCGWGYAPDPTGGLTSPYPM